MRFLVDAQLPAALARWIDARGFRAEHVLDCGLLEAADEAIWAHAVQIDAVIVTKDEDFAIRQTVIGAGPAIVWVRLGNCRKAALLQAFESAMPGIVRALEAGERRVDVY